MAIPYRMARFYADEHKRFRIEVFCTRLGKLECFGFDAQDLSDEEIRQGHMIEPFAQGTLESVWAAIVAREPSITKS